MKKLKKKKRKTVERDIWTFLCVVPNFKSIYLVLKEFYVFVKDMQHPEHIKPKLSSFDIKLANMYNIL